MFDELPEKFSKDLTIRVAGLELDVKKEYLASLYLNCEHMSFMYDLLNEFKVMYSKYRGIDNAISSIDRDVKSIFSSYCKLLCDKLIAAGVYDYNEEALMDKLNGEGCPTPLIDAVEMYIEKYVDILESEADKDVYRAQRRQARGRVIGGGFGFEGALTGMFQAGAINFAAGVAHGIFNVTAKLFSSMGANSKKDSIYFSNDNLYALITGLQMSLYNCYDVYVDIINKENSLSLFDNKQLDERRRKSSILFENITKANLPDDKYKIQISKVISLDITNPIYYERILATSSKEETLELITFLMNLNDLNHEIYSFVDSYVKSQIDDALNVKDDVSTSVDSISNVNITEVIQKRLSDIKDIYHGVEADKIINESRIDRLKSILLSNKIDNLLEQARVILEIKPNITESDINRLATSYCFTKDILFGKMLENWVKLGLAKNILENNPEFKKMNLGSGSIEKLDEIISEYREFASEKLQLYPNVDQGLADKLLQSTGMKFPVEKPTKVLAYISDSKFYIIKGDAFGNEFIYLNRDQNINSGCSMEYIKSVESSSDGITIDLDLSQPRKDNIKIADQTMLNVLHGVISKYVQYKKENAHIEKELKTEIAATTVQTLDTIIDKHGSDASDNIFVKNDIDQSVASKLFSGFKYLSEFTTKEIKLFSPIGSDQYIMIVDNMFVYKYGKMERLLNIGSMVNIVAPGNLLKITMKNGNTMEFPMPSSKITNKIKEIVDDYISLTRA